MEPRISGTKKRALMVIAVIAVAAGALAAPAFAQTRGIL